MYKLHLSVVLPSFIYLNIPSPECGQILFFSFSDISSTLTLESVYKSQKLLILSDVINPGKFIFELLDYRYFNFYLPCWLSLSTFLKNYRDSEIKQL